MQYEVFGTDDPEKQPVWSLGTSSLQAALNDFRELVLQSNFKHVYIQEFGVTFISYDKPEPTPSRQEQMKEFFKECSSVDIITVERKDDHA